MQSRIATSTPRLRPSRAASVTDIARPEVMNMAQMFEWKLNMTKWLLGLPHSSVSSVVACASSESAILAVFSTMTGRSRLVEVGLVDADDRARQRVAVAD